jgi:hypothetical protein
MRPALIWAALVRDRQPRPHREDDKLRVIPRAPLDRRATDVGAYRCYP